ncbi:NCS2 family permease [Kocuria rhizophila]|uniref:NCS2 family permease n=1 Tax=Kocuria rhizophila TaxID=72000 RepID=UPI001ABDAEB0|nr:NCS2 family permease [Kocuria rhizophila]MBO4145491.1 NCS2 family permease [Kocuria rhizophila]MDN3225199.1 NCS2 family permease [Kocuria rhizophila]QTK31711.1 NCS2 family permease [Kocuria rhizophila]
MSSSTPPAQRSEPRGGLDRFFSITRRGSTVGREVRGGVATFIAMSYIVVLNPLVLGYGPDGAGNALGGERVAAMTALVAGVLTILMGVWAKSPFGMAAGLGVNAFLAVTIATNPGLTWPQVMGLVIWAGVIMVVLVVTGFRTAVFNAVPDSLKTAIVVGIGLFIALIGFVNAGFVRRIPDAAHTTVPVQLGTGGELFGWPTLTFVVGLLLTVALMVRNVRGGILISVVLTTVLAHVLEAVSPSGSSVDNPHGWSLVVPSSPEALFAVPDLSLLGSAAPIDAFRELGGIACALLIFTILLSIFFDAMGTMVGLSRQAGLEDADGQIENVDRVLLVDALGAVAGGAGSVSSNQIFVESSTGIADGARTGLANVVTGVLFLAAMFLTPLVNVVPFEAVAPAMVVVGFLMARNVVAIDWADLGVAIPAFLTFAVMPFTYSIANGIGAGFVSYVFIRLVQGRAKDVHPLMYVVALAFVAFFGIGVIEGWAG